MCPPRALTALATLLAACALLCATAAAAHDVLYDITDEQYYSMPPLFQLDEYEGCLATRGVYCLGSFDLLPERDAQPLYDVMQRYSANWVDNFNHTRLHRGYCLPRRCRRYAPPPPPRPATSLDSLQTWFSSCVNATTMSAYNLSARLYRLDYCHSQERAGAGEEAAARAGELTASEQAFAGFVAALVALTAVCTVLDMSLPDHARKDLEWALAWSVPGCWRALHAPPPRSAQTDLRSFDGLRVLTMMCVIVEHVCWITTHSYLADTRRYEQDRRGLDVVMMANSTLVVQIFFMMSSFLLAHKLLQQRRRGEAVQPMATFVETMVNRIIRISPSYFVVVWFASSWWERLGGGPVWAPLVGAEAAVCRDKWWTHLLYLNNILYADDKCLIQTWYLAADMQLYAVALALTLVLRRWRRAAVAVLAALLAGSVALLFGLAYHWHLVPTFVMHRPESVRASYRGDASFNVLYQSPLGNVPGALAGLLLAHAHHMLIDRRVHLAHYKVFRWVSVASVPLAAWWVAASPLALGRGPPSRGAAAALAALERPVFATFVAMALLGSMHSVPSFVQRVLSWAGWSAWARLSFGALLLHMPINKSLVAARLVPSQLDRQAAVIEWFGVAVVSYLAALPLALLVEFPAQRLHRALGAGAARRAPPPPQPQPPARPATTTADRASEKADL